MPEYKILFQQKLCFKKKSSLFRLGVLKVSMEAVMNEIPRTGPMVDGQRYSAMVVDLEAMRGIGLEQIIYIPDYGLNILRDGRVTKEDHYMSLEQELAIQALLNQSDEENQEITEERLHKVEEDAFKYTVVKLSRDTVELINKIYEDASDAADRESRIKQAVLPIIQAINLFPA